MDRADSAASLPPAEGSRKHRVLRNAQTQQLEELMVPRPGRPGGRDGQSRVMGRFHREKHRKMPWENGGGLENGA